MSTLQATNLKNASSASNNIVLDTAGNATVAGTMAMGSSYLRNRIINGDMRIDQRNAGAGITPTASAYSVDRWQLQVTQASKVTIGQSGGVNAGGMVNSLRALTAATVTSPAASDFFLIRQAVEGFNIADFNWGTGSAVAVTLSFWVQSSLTGTFAGSLSNNANNRSYPFTYTISAANTWERKTVTIPGDTTGTWLADNSTGVNVWFTLCTGSNYVGTANSWNASLELNASGTVNVLGTSGATFYITGVQLEAGTVATPFERRQYGQELALCQRYYQAGLARLRGTQASGVLESTMLFPVTMRATPTMTGTDISALSSATLLISTTLNSTGNVSWTASIEL